MRINSVTISNNRSNFRRSNVLMRSIPRMKQGRAAFELHNASVSMLMSPSSYGVYTDKVIAATQRKNENTVHCLISNPDK